MRCDFRRACRRLLAAWAPAVTKTVPALVRTTVNPGLACELTAKAPNARAATKAAEAKRIIIKLIVRRLEDTT